MGRGRGLSLVGYRGTGKTSTGRILAGKLGRPFADADEALAALAGRPLRAVFVEDGEPAFRDLEGQIIADLTARPGGLVLATGGGAVLRGSNRDALRRLGAVVWLTAGPDVLARRLRDDARGLASRPALSAAGTLDEIAAVLAEREPLYRSAADFEVETTGLTAAEVAEAVLERLGRVAGGVSP